MRPRTQLGVTLVELMVVVIIIGILAAAATIAFRTDPTSEAARAVTGVLGEARRRAISGGPVDPAVIATAGSARTMVDVQTIGDVDIVTLYELDDTVNPAQWVPLSSFRLPGQVSIYAVDDEPEPDPGSTINDFRFGQTTEVFFYANGTADRDNDLVTQEGFTFYLGNRQDASRGDKFKIFVNPLSGIAQTVKGW